MQGRWLSGSGFLIVLIVVVGLVLGACQPGSPDSRTGALAAGTTCSAADIANRELPCPGHNPDAGICIVQVCDRVTGIASACFTVPDCELPLPFPPAGDGAVACGSPGARAGCTGPAPDYRGGYMACLVDGSWGDCSYFGTPAVLDAGVPDSGIPPTCAGEGDVCTVGAPGSACERTGNIICVDSTPTCNVSGALPTSESEVCNGLDDDCDGLVDEDSSRSCYSGAAGTDGIGLCRRGLEACTAVAGSGVAAWSGTCVGEVLPGIEVLDNADDEDCNGGALMSAPCGGDPRVGELCSAGLPGSSCYDEGIYSCVGSELRCSAVSTPPVPETCNNLDDDCDGMIDGNWQSCYDGPPGTAEVGNCQVGFQQCVAGAWTPSTCTDDIVPTAEVCDNLFDEDCNGLAEVCVVCGGDPRLGATCSEGVGACARDGLFLCLGATVECTARAGSPEGELCNNLDDDCNGITDNDVIRSCNTLPGGGTFDPTLAGIGACTLGTQTCNDGTFAACTGAVGPVTEIAGNGIDEDCTGGDLVLAPCGGDPRVRTPTACTVSTGACARAGTYACFVVTGGYELRCDSAAPAISPTPEACNGLDDDCDGLIDESATGSALTRSCWSGSTGLPDVGICRSGTQTCSGGTFGIVCTGEVLPGTETCNGLDDDCDGAVDEGCVAPVTDAGVDAGMDAGMDAGLDAGVDAGSDAGSDSGTIDSGSTDAGSDSGLVTDSGSVVDAGSGSSTVAGASCGSVGTGTLGITIDNAGLDALFGTCASGRRIGIWDQCGQFLFSPVGSSSLNLTGVLVGAGYYMAVVQCGAALYAWPTVTVGQSAGLNGFASIMLNGAELADGDALICHDQYSDPGGSSTTYNRLAIPTQPILWGLCPSAP